MSEFHEYEERFRDDTMQKRRAVVTLILVIVLIVVGGVWGVLATRNWEVRTRDWVQSKIDNDPDICRNKDSDVEMLRAQSKRGAAIAGEMIEEACGL